MTELKRLSNKCFTTAAAILFWVKLFLKFSFSALKLDIFRFYAYNKMHIKVAAVTNDIKLLILVKLNLSAICLTKTVPIRRAPILFNYSNDTK